MNETRLSGDVKGKVPFLSKKFTIEAKTGYGGSKQLAIKKEWFDKVRKEAENSNAIPLLACKFSNARSGVKHFIAMDFKAFTEILESANELYEDFIRLQDKLDAEYDWEVMKADLEE